MSGVQAKLDQAARLLADGKADAAVALLQPMARARPRDAAVAGLLSVAFARVGRFEPAAHYGCVACELCPGDAGLVTNAALALQGCGRRGEARALLEKGVVASPADVPLRLALANMLLDDLCAQEAASHCEAALAQGPNPEVTITHAGALLSLCRGEEAAASLGRALGAHPAHEELLASMASAMNYVPGMEAGAVYAVHRRYGESLERGVPSQKPMTRVTRGHEGRLRVGFLSPDLRTHSVAFFLEPLIEHLDRAAFESVAYFTSVHADATTARLRGTFGVWRDVAARTPLQIAQQIVDDRIDILIDLAGHTQGAGLLVMALKPAPLQATYLGYPNTTGLNAVDLRLVDSITDPAGSEAWASERLMRMDPCFLCWRPPMDAPGTERDAHEGVVFGSFNASQKINRPLLGLWARVLREVSGSRLVLKSMMGLREPGVRRFIEEAMREEGIDASRVSFLPASAGVREHLACYAGVDVALDTQPYHGTTTTCEALYMGVPVVTLAGRAHAQRVGASLLDAAGLKDLVATDEAGYVRLAASLAADGARRAQLRAELRGRLEASPLRDEAGFAARFGAALLGAWRA